MFLSDPDEARDQTDETTPDGKPIVRCAVRNANVAVECPNWFEFVLSQLALGPARPYGPCRLIPKHHPGELTQLAQLFCGAGPTASELAVSRSRHRSQTQRNPIWNDDTVHLESALKRCGLYREGQGLCGKAPSPTSARSTLAATFPRFCCFRGAWMHNSAEKPTAS